MEAAIREVKRLMMTGMPPAAAIAQAAEAYCVDRHDLAVALGRRSRGGKTRAQLKKEHQSTVPNRMREHYETRERKTET